MMKGEYYVDHNFHIAITMVKNPTTNIMNIAQNYELTARQSP